MMPIVDWQALSPAQRATTLRRPTQNARAEVITATREIIAEVRAGGDTALFELTRHFDGADLDSLAVGEAEFAAAARALAGDVRQALERAIENVRRFHEAQVLAHPADFRALAEETAALSARLDMLDARLAALAERARDGNLR